MEVEVGFFLKNKLPEGKFLVSGLRVKIPSFVDTAGLEGSERVGVSVGVTSFELGGEWSLMKEMPYFSF